MLHSEDSTGLPDHRTAVFTNFNLSNLVPQFNTNMMEKCNNRATYNNKLHIFKKVILNKKWTKIPPVSPQNYEWTT